MSSKWFDFDEELSSNRDSFEILKKNLGFTVNKAESERKLRSWSSVNKVSDIFDLDSTGTGIFKDKPWDSVLKERLMGKSKYCEHQRISDTECDELLTDLSESARKIRNRFSREFDSDMPDRRMHVRDSPSCSSTFSYPESCGDRTWSRKSSCQGNVTFPESSTASVNSDTTSEKSFGRSLSVNSEESVCTEKSADCSTVCETLPDGTNKTQFENNETWLAKSTSGSVCEKKVKDSTVTEKNDDRLCDKTTKKTSYIERSATGSSLQEESTSERVVSCDKTGKKTVEQKTSSETYKKAYRSPKSTSSFYDELDSCSFRGRQANYRKSVDGSGKTASEKISKLIDEAVHQDNIFRIPSNLEADIDRMTSDFAEKEQLRREKRRHNRRRLSGLFSEYGRADHDLNWRKLKELEIENEALIQENSKLQSIIQDVRFPVSQVRRFPVSQGRERWEDSYNNACYSAEKLQSIVGEVESQMRSVIQRTLDCSRNSVNDTCGLEYAVKRMSDEINNHICTLRAERESCKHDWEAVRKEKERVIHEKENLEKKVQTLMTEVKSLKDALTDEMRKPKDVPKTFRTAVHVPYNMDDLSTNENFFHDDYLSLKCLSDQRSYFSSAGSTSLNKRFSECSINTAGETIVVNDENGICLSVTEQFPSKDSQLKSILKKNDKKQKMLLKKLSDLTDVKKSGRNRKTSTDDRQLACTECESQSVSIGFEKDGLAKVTSFSPHTIPDSVAYLHPNTEFLNVGVDIRSKSEPNTRSNSPHILKSLKESSP